MPQTRILRPHTTYKMGFGPTLNYKTIVVANHTLINVCQLAYVIWSDRRHINTIYCKAKKAYINGLLYRMSPKSADILVEETNLRDQLEAWCHRDATAREALVAFDFDSLHNRMHVAHKRNLQDKADEHGCSAADHTAKRRRLLIEIDAMK